MNKVEKDKILDLINGALNNLSASRSWLCDNKPIQAHSKIEDAEEKLFKIRDLI